MNILVTGGGGFVGKAVIRQLLERGYRVRSLARGAYPELEALGVEVRRADLADREAVFSAAQGCDAVMHIGAKAGYWGAYDGYYQANVVGTENVIAACRTHGISKLVYTSSPSVIDAGGDILGADESIPYPTRFDAPYSETKALAEQRILAANDAQLSTVAIRPPFIWGEGDNQITPRIIARARAGRLVRVGWRENIIDATYIENVADAHLLALDKLAPASPIAGKTYFISNGQPMTILEVMNGLIGAAGLPPISRTVPTPAVYALGWTLETVYKLTGQAKEPPVTRYLAQQLSKSRWFDISAARRDLGYEPRISMQEGFERLKRSLQGG